jgi:hypothetical protein
MKERLRTIAAMIALAASGPTLMIAVGNWSGYLSDDWAIDALILMSCFGLPASAYLITSYWCESNARNTIVIEHVSSRQVAPSRAGSRRTTLRLVSSA